MANSSTLNYVRVFLSVTITENCLYPINLFAWGMRDCVMTCFQELRNVQHREQHWVLEKKSQGILAVIDDVIKRSLASHLCVHYLI